MVRLAIVHKEKCKPTACGKECSLVCPINKKGEDCVVVAEGKKARIDEKLCIGCAICEKRCPFGAIDIVNMPGVDEKNLVYRYGENGFALYGLPVPKSGAVVGFLGRNGIGKSTAVELLAGKKEINLGVFDQEGAHPIHDSLSESYRNLSRANRSPTPNEVESNSKSIQGNLSGLSAQTRKFLKGSELLRYFDSLHDKKIAYKPQNLSSLSVDVKVIDLLKKRGGEKKIISLVKELGVEYILENKLNKLSGGELQKVALIASVLGEADVYFFDEPLAFLDIAERLKISDFIKSISQGKSVLVVEHDLLILDYLTEYLNIFYGQQGAFGSVSGLKSSSNGVNSYLSGFLKEENMKIRNKELNFNFTKNKSSTGKKIADWPDFEICFGDGESKVPTQNRHLELSSPPLSESNKVLLNSKSDEISGANHQKGFNLSVKSGDIKQNHVIGVLGKNGTGKTSFVKALVGEQEVFIDGKKQKLNLDLEISYKPQYLFVEQEEIVRDIMIKEKIGKKISSMFNLGVLQQKKICELSGGELQRFSIARCLSKKADVYFFDEPSAYLDVEERISVAKAIKDLMIEKERTAFVVDHDLLLISYLADSVLVFSGESGKSGNSGDVLGFEEGISQLLKELDITLRKDKQSGRPRINKKGSVLDREQREKGKWAIF